MKLVYYYFMSNLLSSYQEPIHASLALAVIVFIVLFFQNDGFSFDRLFWSWLTRFFSCCSSYNVDRIIVVF